MDIGYAQPDVDKVAKMLLEEVQTNGSRTIGLSGDLGAGKTTLVQAIAKILGVQEHVVSPTFVIAKFYPLSGGMFSQLVHIDAYRIESPEELVPLGWETLLSDEKALIVIEWPERIEAALPEAISQYRIDHKGEVRHIISL